MTTLWQRLEPKLAAFKLRDEKNGNYRLNSPLRAGSNSHAFHIVVNADGNSGAYIDHARGERGSLAALAEQLGVEVERKQATNTKRAYVNPFYYAEAHGVDWQVFEAAGWSYTTQHDTNGRERPALKIPTANGDRYRFLDGEKPTYHSPAGYKNCWYGLDRSTKIDNGKVWVLCNGPASVVVAQHYGIQAASLAGGGQRIPDHLLPELKAKWGNRPIIIALDCDNEGRAATQNYSQQLPNALIVDLGLTDGGDLADFCMLYQQEAYAELLKRAVAIPKDDTPEPADPNGYKIVERSKMLTPFIANLSETKANANPPVIFPLTVLHKFGGLCKVLRPGKMVAVVSTSGGSKTSYLETMTDIFLSKGIRSILWSPEWDSDELMERAIMRNGGPTDEAFALHELYKWEKAQGKQYNFEGRPLTQAQIESASQAVGVMRGWMGDVAFLDMPIARLERFGEAIGDIMTNAAQPYQVLMMDYIQLMHALEAQEMGVYELLQRIKVQIGAYHKLIVFCATQATKEDTRNAPTKLLNSQSARYVNDDAFNLFITLNVEYTEFGIPMDSSVINVCKNSSGMKGMVRVKTQLDRYRYLDELADNQNFDMYKR